MIDAHPALRPDIQAFPTEYEGETLFRLHDQSGLSTAELAVGPLFMYVASQLDGKTSVLDIQDRFFRESNGRQLALDQVEEVLKALDECLFLQGRRFDDFVAESMRTFFDSPHRCAASAGSAYDKDPVALRRYLDELLAAAPDAEEALPDGDEAPRGVIVPHIDYPRGASGYGQLYRFLQSRKRPERIVVLGTAHCGLRNRVALLNKGFEVPGGVVPCDQEATELLRKACLPCADFQDDAFAHRSEHSVELQAVWIHHLWGGDVPIVPVLVGSVGSYVMGMEEPDAIRQDEQFQAFQEALVRLQENAPGTMIMASADLSHIGPRFEDEREVNETFLSETEEADRAYLAAVASGDAVSGLAELARHQDRYHVCGSGCIYVLNAALGEARGALLGYHQAATPEMSQAVTFASMVFA